MKKLIKIIIFIFIIFILEAKSDARGRRVKRIVDGVDGLRQDFSFQVSVRHNSRGKYQQFCGGSIIDEQFILTAAHCTKAKKMENVQIVFGVINLNDIIDDNDPKFTRKAIGMYSHKYFDNPNQYTNDLGIIKVEKPILFDYVNVAPIDLPALLEPVVTGTKVAISGWGRTYGPDSPLSSTLKVATVVVVNHENCIELYKRYKRTVYSTQFCTHAYEKNATRRRGVCNCDSGGPVTGVVWGKRVLVGVISWGLKDPDCASPKFPDVHIKVSHYLNWIYQVMDRHRSEVIETPIVKEFVKPLEKEIVTVLKKGIESPLIKKSNTITKTRYRERKK